MANNFEEILSNWQFVLPPSRPSIYELERVKSYLLNVNKNERIAVLGSTIEYRNLLHTMGFKDIYIFEKNPSFYNWTQGWIVEKSPNEKIVWGDWLDTIKNYREQFAVVLSDLTMGNIPYEKRFAFYQDIYFALKSGGGDRSEKGNGRGFFYRRGAQCTPLSKPIHSVRYRSATHTVKSTQVRQNGVAQFVCVLLRTAPASYTYQVTPISSFPTPALQEFFTLRAKSSLKGIKLLIPSLRVRREDEILLRKQILRVCIEQLRVFLNIRCKFGHIVLGDLAHEDLTRQIGRCFITS